MKKSIAITGGIGSGKSTLAQIITDAGYPVYSCDEIYQEIIKSEEYIQKIQAAFPTAVRNDTIDKKAVKIKWKECRWQRK